MVVPIYVQSSDREAVQAIQFKSQKENFMSLEEYGKMLYYNPRGISCAKCHGKRGEGSIIAKYREGGELKVLKGSDIRSKSLETFHHVLNQSYHPIMPVYYLTEKEIRAIYGFIAK
jgi:mono/diheme cytochrome c family protein